MELTPNQLSALSFACEVVARLGIGQIDHAMEALPIRPYLTPGWHDAVRDVERIIERLPGYRGPLGITNESVEEFTKVLWDLYQVLRQRQAWDMAIAEGVVDSHDSPRDWDKMMAVVYDDPMKTSREPLAKISAA